MVAENDLVIVDLAEAEFIDASFMNALVRADREARSRGGRVCLLVATAPIVYTALSIGGLLDHLDSALTGEEAVSLPNAAERREGLGSWSLQSR